MQCVVEDRLEAEAMGSFVLERSRRSAGLLRVGNWCCLLSKRRVPEQLPAQPVTESAEGRGSPAPSTPEPVVCTPLSIPILQIYATCVQCAILSDMDGAYRRRNLAPGAWLSRDWAQDQEKENLRPKMETQSARVRRISALTFLIEGARGLSPGSQQLEMDLDVFRQVAHSGTFAVTFPGPLKKRASFLRELQVTVCKLCSADLVA